MSTTSRRAVALGVVLLLLLLALAAAFALAVLRRPAQARVRLAGKPLSVLQAFSPQDPQFGDTVTATIRVFLDSDRVDVGSVRVESSFAPYRIASSRRAVRRTGGVSSIDVADRLTCLDTACAPAKEGKAFHFAPVRVSYRDRSRLATLSIPWPPLRVHTRVTSNDLQHPFLRVSPPQAAHADYRLPPRVTGYGLIALAALLALAGGALLVRGGLHGLGHGLGLPRRGGAAPLDRILDELTTASANGDSGRRRRALEELAQELEPLDELLSVESRVLAWAPEDPHPEAIADLTSRVLGAVRP